MRKLFLGQGLKAAQVHLEPEVFLLSQKVKKMYPDQIRQQSDCFQTTEDIQKKKQTVFIYSGELKDLIL